MVAFSPYLARLRALPLITSVRFSSGKSNADGSIEIRYGTSRESWAVEQKARASLEIVRDAAVRLRRAHPRPLFCAPYVSGQCARILIDADLDFIDLAGNARLRGHGYYVQIEGRKPERPLSTSRGIRAAGFLALFALLVDQDLARAPIRVLADAAGVGKSAAAELIRRLQEEGRIVGTGRGRRLIRPEELIGRWVEGWATIVRPRLYQGRFKPRLADPMKLEEQVASILGDGDDWAFGGGAAAYRMTGYYRGPQTVLHIAHPLGDFPRVLEAVPSRDGALTIFRAPSKLGLRAKGPWNHCAHPLLVYAELVARGDDREREAAEKLRERLLQ